jgi:predicted secreted Zn-dependent protease
MFSMSKRFATRLVIAASVVATLELAAQPAPALKAAPPREIANQNPNVIRTDYYEVRGATAEALLAAMKANQPSTRHASTEWHVDWNYEYLLKRDECILRSLNVRVRVRFTLPQWVDSERADEALQGEWKRYFGALQLHESGHAGLGIAAAKEMVRLVNSREWRAPDRTELKAQIDEACDKVVQEFRARDVAYDEKTDHGRTQGARLNTTRDDKPAGTRTRNALPPFQKS